MFVCWGMFFKVYTQKLRRVSSGKGTGSLLEKHGRENFTIFPLDFEPYEYMNYSSQN